MTLTREQLITALEKAFGPDLSPGWQDAIYTGADDPGKWDPAAVFIVGTETGLPSCAFRPEWDNAWDSLDIPGHYAGTINAAVVGIYRED